MDLFVYGTLLIPELTKALLGYTPENKPAFIQHYLPVTFFINQKESEYPILKYKKESITNGVILFDLTEKDLKILRLYEGDEYILKAKKINIENKTIIAYVFMLANSKAYKYGKVWDVISFKQNHLKTYLTQEIPNLLKILQHNN